MMLGQEGRERMTISQRKRLAKTRDCPACSGVLDRVEIYEEDRMIVERYHHNRGNPDCEGNEADNGFWREDGQYVIHYRDGSEGGGILRGEFE